MSMPLVRWQFRRLLKSASELFRHDSFAMKNARQELRDQFMKNRNMTDHNELAALYRGIDEVDEMMRFNVVQAKMNTRGNYEVSLSTEHSVTIEAGQSDPNGTEISPADSSLLGNPVKIEKTKGKKTEYHDITRS